MAKDIYELKLNESTKIFTPSSMICVTRVPGGWIYFYCNMKGLPEIPIFVPYNNEFQKTQPVPY